MKTKGFSDVRDIMEEVRTVVGKSRIKQGLTHVSSPNASRLLFHQQVFGLSLESGRFRRKDYFAMFSGRRAAGPVGDGIQYSICFFV